MKIDRSNYEIWIIDWLDGNLNSSQEAQLNLFLDQNPDLREEFNDLTHPKLLSPAIEYQNKANLQKSSSDISQAQFEYLCAAYLENDLTLSQKEEVEEMIKNSPERRKIFGHLQKTFLVPEKTTYKHKNLLLKRTSYKKVIWLSGLSIAAAISLIIVIYSVLPSTTSSVISNSAQSFVTDSLIQGPSSVTPKANKGKEIKTEPSGKKRENRSQSISGSNNVSTHTGTILANAVDTSKRTIDNNEMAIEKVSVHSPVELKKEPAGISLIQSIPKTDVSVAVNERNSAGKFISKTIREKILKIKSPADTPLKGYEIAEAGVTGLNKLLGWQMALDMKKDENGQAESVTFSSGILKIQTPVKKRESQP